MKKIKYSLPEEFHLVLEKYHRAPSKYVLKLVDTYNLEQYCLIPDVQAHFCGSSLVGFIVHRKYAQSKTKICISAADALFNTIPDEFEVLSPGLPMDRVVKYWEKKCKLDGCDPWKDYVCLGIYAKIGFSLF